MPERNVQTAVKSRVLGRQDDCPASGFEHSTNVCECRGDILHVLEHVQHDRGVELAAEIAKVFLVLCIDLHYAKVGLAHRV